MTPSLENMQQDPWYQSRPKCIQQAIDIYFSSHMCHMLRFKDSGKHCYIIGIDEPHSGKLEDVTFTVQKTGEGGVLSMLNMAHLDSNRVFGVKPDSLEPLDESIPI